MAEETPLGQNLGIGYFPTYGELVAANDFWGATGLDDLICGKWEDFVQAGTAKEAIRRLSAKEAEARFMKFFNMAFTGKGMDDPKLIRMEYEKELSAAESALAKQLENPENMLEEEIEHALQVLTIIEVSRALSKHGSQAFRNHNRLSIFANVPSISNTDEAKLLEPAAMSKIKGLSQEDRNIVSQHLSQRYRTLARGQPAKVKQLFDKLSGKLLEAAGLSENHGNVLHNFKDLGDTRHFWNFQYAIEVAKFNFDHFSPCMEFAFAVGHRLALREAYQAGERDKDLNGRDIEAFSEDQGAPEIPSLEKAYAINAFADHALSDMFAAGHIRTPRVEIAKMCIRPGTSYLQVHTLSAAITAQQMHEEDGRNGLLVTDKSGSESWWAYGDGSLLEFANKRNLEKMVEALKLSREQVYQAYQAGAKGSTAFLESAESGASTNAVLQRQPYVPTYGDPNWKPEFALANTCPRFSVGERGELRIREHSDQMARSKSMLQYRRKELSRDLKFYASSTTCLDREFVKREAGGYYNDCNSGSQVSKVSNVLFEGGIARRVDEQEAVIAVYPYLAPGLQVGGCWEKRGAFSAEPAYGSDGALYCRCPHGARCAVFEGGNPFCEASSSCSESEHEPGRCFPAECARTCWCDPESV